MALSLKDIAGGEWESLGLPAGHAERQDAAALGWDDLASLLAEPLPADPRSRLRLALVRLEALDDMEGAARLLNPLAGDLPDAAWLLRQVALQQETVASLQAWREQVRPLLDPEQRALARLEVALLTLIQEGTWVPPEGGALIGEDGQPVAQEVAGPVERRITGLLLAVQERWEELAELLVAPDNGDLVDRLLAAHLLGDRLHRPDRQAELLRAAHQETPLWTAEVLLELTSRTGNDQSLATSLRRRLDVLNAMGDELLSDAAATAALLMAREPAVMDLPWLDDRAAGRAWRRVEALTARLARRGDPRMLCQQYMDDSRVAPAPLRPVLRLRAAELFLADGAFHEALAAMPDEDCEPHLAELAERHQALCMAWQRDWDGLGLALAKRAAREAPADERAAMARLAAVLASRDPRRSRETMSIVEDLRRELGCRELDGTLLATHRRQAAAEQLADSWEEACRGAAEAGDVELESLCAFGGGLVRLRLGQAGEALQAFSRAGRGHEEDAVIRAGVLLALQQQERWPEVNLALEDLSEHVSGDASVDLLRLAAHLAVARADHPEQAVALLDRVLEQRPDDLSAIQEAIALRFRLQRFDEAVELLEKAGSLAPEPGDAADLRCTVGILMQHKLGDPTRAEEAFREALRSHPLHLTSLRALRRLLVEQERTEEMPPVLADLLQLALDDEDRLRILVDLSSLHRQIWSRLHREEDSEACLRYAGEALAVDPSCEPAARNLVHVCVKQRRWKELIGRLDMTDPPLAGLRGLRKALQEVGDWERLAAVCWALAERSTTDRERLAAALRAGDLYLEKLGDQSQAERCYRWTTDQFVAPVPLLRLANLLRGQGRHEDLAEVLPRQLELVDQEPEQIPILLELGQLLAGRLDRAAEARERFERVLELDPTNSRASEALELLMEDVVSQNDLARVLEQLLETTRDRRQELRILLRLGTVYREMDDERSTLRMATRLHHDFAAEPEAVAFVEQVYRELERFNDLCELYARRAEALERAPGQEEEIAELLLRKGGIELDRLGALAEGTESLMRVVELRPGDSGTLARLEQILGEAGEWARLVEVFERRANSVSSRQDQIASLRQAARIAQRELRQEAESSRLYERIHALDPTDAESFSFLEKKLERMDDSRQLVKLLVDRAGRVEAGDEGLRYLLRAAAICVKIADLPRATAIYLEVLALAPRATTALEALSRIYESQERWDDLLEITRRQIELEKDPSAKAVLLFKCGSIMETQRDDEETARRFYTSAVKVSPSCLPALHSLRDLYMRRSDWESVVATLETEARVWTDAKGRADVLARIAEVQAQKLGDGEAALEYYKKAIRANPKCMPAALALFDTYTYHGNHDEAAVWGDIYARRVHLRGSKMQRADFYVRWAEVLSHVGRFEESAQYLVQALQIRPGLTDALYSLLDLCRESPEAYDFSEAFADLLEEAEKREDTLACGILSTACGVLAEHQSDLDAALHLFEQGLSSAGEQIRLVRPLADLLVFLGREEEARELVERCEARTREEGGDDWAAAMLWLMDHDLLWTRDYSAVVERGLEVLRRAPERHDARLRMARAELMRNRSDVARVEYGRICEQLEQQGADEDLLARRHHARGIAALRLGDREAAAHAFQIATRKAPSWPYPRIGMARDQAARGDWEEAERLLARARRDCGGFAGQSDLLRASAALDVIRGNAGRAVGMMREVVASPGADPGDMVYLARLLAQAGASEQSVPLLRQAIAHTGDHLPAIEDLQRVWLDQGNSSLARRGAQVISLATGKRTVIEPPPLSWKPLSRGTWNKLMGALLPQPLDALYRLLGRQLDRRFTAPSPPCSRVTLAEVQGAFSEMTKYFGVRMGLRRLDEQGPVFRLHGRRLVISPQASQLEIVELRQVMAMGLTASRSGYQLMLSIAPDQRQALGRLLASLLVPGEVPPESEELLVDLSRREHKQYVRLVEQHAITMEEAEGAAEHWVAAVEAMCVRVSLLVTDDVLSLAKVMAMQVGISPSWAFRGGLLAAVPGLQPLVGYYLSDEFHQSRLAILG